MVFLRVQIMVLDGESLILQFFEGVLDHLPIDEQVLKRACTAAQVVYELCSDSTLSSRQSPSKRATH
jgi:hypothetical protein